jgi:hypothetical protein
MIMDVPASDAQRRGERALSEQLSIVSFARVGDRLRYEFFSKNSDAAFVAARRNASIDFTLTMRRRRVQRRDTGVRFS